MNLLEKLSDVEKPGFHKGVLHVSFAAIHRASFPSVQSLERQITEIEKQDGDKELISQARAILENLKSVLEKVKAASG